MTPELMGHELGHIVLGHMDNGKQPLQDLPPDGRWDRFFFQVNEKPGERAKTIYFSRYLNQRLAGLDWLENLTIVDLDNLR